MVADDLFDALNTYGKRGLRLVAVLAEMHLNIAQREAIQEQKRITGGAIALGVGATLLSTGFVLIQVLIVLLAYFSEQNWLAINLGLIAFDLFLGGLLAIVGLRTLRGPYMVETTAQLARTTAMLTQED